MPGRIRERGFTVLELLVAIALLGSLGVFLAQLVRNSFALYRQGERRGEIYLEAVPILEDLERDILDLHGGASGRFLVDTDTLGGQSARGDGFFMRIVRGIPDGEQGHGVLRRAGTSINAGEAFVGADPGAERRSSIAPPSGLLEVAWVLLPDDQDQGDREGLLTLYRGVRAPALGQGGFFDPSLEGSRDANWVRQNLVPVASNILGIWVLSFAQTSEDWLEDAAIDGSTAAGTSLLRFDSTRGILGKERFALAVGPGSLNDARDDIFPRSIRVVLQLARGSRPETRLRRSASPDDNLLRVIASDEIPEPTEGVPLYAKVGHEWVEIVGKDGGDLRVRRRVRRSGNAHESLPVGTPVFVGKVFRKTMSMSQKRSHFLENSR